MRGVFCLLSALVALGVLVLPAAAAPVRFRGGLWSETRGTTRITLRGRTGIPLTPGPGGTGALGVMRCRPATGRCFRRHGRFTLLVSGEALHGTLTFGPVQCSLTGQLFHLGCREPCGTSFQGTFVCERELRQVDQGTFLLRPILVR